MYGQSYLALGCANESRDSSRASESNMSTGIVKGEGTSVLGKIVVPCPEHPLAQIDPSMFERLFIIFFSFGGCVEFPSLPGFLTPSPHRLLDGLKSFAQ